MARSASSRSRCIAALLLPPLALAIGAQSPPPAGRAHELLAQLPARIVPNLGQWQSPELYRLQLGGMQVFLEHHGWSLWLEEAAPPRPQGSEGAPRHAHQHTPPPPRRSVAVRMSFLGADSARPTAERPLAGVTNFLLGADPARHRRGVAGFAAVRYESMYPGIDVRVREAGGHMEYDLLLAPGADLAQVRIQVTGAQSTSIDASGTLVVETPLGAIRQPKPATWMHDAKGEQRPVACAYELRGDGCFGFVAPDRDPALALVVDPPLLYSTYFGGSTYDGPSQVLEDGTGRILVCGYTESQNFPTSPGAIQTTHGGALGDGFLMLLDPSQPPASQVVFATYFGGSAYDSCNGVTMLPGGLIAFSGETQSPNLPTSSSSYQAVHAGGNDVFVGLLDPLGAVLLACTYLGSSSNEWGYAIQAAPTGELYVIGQTQSPQFPTTPNAYAATHAGGPNMRDGFVARLDTQCTTLSYSTFLGGSGDEWLACAGIDAAGALSLFGCTSSTDFPVTPNGFDTVWNGGTIWWGADVAVAVLDPSLPPAQQLVYGTFLGGSGEDYAYGGRRTSTGEIVVTGTTTSTNFPTTSGAYQGSFAGGANTVNYLAGDAFVAKVAPNAPGTAGLAASTYFGGGGREQGLGCSVDSTGEIVLVGWCQIPSTLPTTPDAMRRTQANNDGFLARFSRDCKQLYYASFVGGTNYDGAWRVDRHADGVATLAGLTASIDVPTMNALQPTLTGGDDGLLARIATIPANTTRRGTATVGSNGHPTIHALGDATLGNQQFGIACSKAPVNKLGALLFAWSASPGVPLFGIQLYVDQSSLVASPFLLSNAQGEQVWSLPLPPFPIGTAHVQYVWLEDANTLLLSASDALQIN